MEPLIYSVGAISFSFQYIIDRLLITYWYDCLAVLDDDLNEKFVRLLKYSPAVWVPTTFVIIFFKTLMPKLSYHQSKLWRDSQFYRCQVYSVSIIIAIFIIWDLYIVFFYDETKKFKEIYGEDVNYFSRLG